MNVLLTGITGNLGHEVALELVRRSISVTPYVRPGKMELLSAVPNRFKEIIEGDLLTAEALDHTAEIDCIVHCAGVVHFRNAEHKNEQMMRTVVAFAQTLSVPVHFASTAFIYRPNGIGTEFTNSYEQDKFNAEEVLKASGLEYSILRPSVLMGNTRTGELQNYSGYYLIVRAFLAAATAARAKSRTLRFPKMTGWSDIVPVDQVAEHFSDTVLKKRFETLFITNPEPPRADWILSETLRFFSLQDFVSVLDISFVEFGGLSLTEEEASLYHFAQSFSPYWSMEYRFPDSDCTENRISREYLERTLTAFRDNMKVTYA